MLYRFWLVAAAEMRNSLCSEPCAKLLIPGKRKLWLRPHLFSGMCKRSAVLLESQWSRFEHRATQGAMFLKYNFVKPFLHSWLFFVLCVLCNHTCFQSRSKGQINTSIYQKHLSLKVQIAPHQCLFRHVWRYRIDNNRRKGCDKGQREQGYVGTPGREDFNE